MNRLVNFNEHGDLLQDVDLRTANKRWQHPWHLVHRVNLRDALQKMATASDGPGAPARLDTASKVMEVDPDKGAIRLSDGRVVNADVVIGADGIYVGVSRLHMVQVLTSFSPEPENISKTPNSSVRAKQPSDF